MPMATMENLLRAPPVNIPRNDARSAPWASRSFHFLRLMPGTGICTVKTKTANSANTQRSRLRSSRTRAAPANDARPMLLYLCRFDVIVVLIAKQGLDLATRREDRGARRLREAVQLNREGLGNCAVGQHLE